MNRLIEYTVFSGFVTAWRLATCPTSRSPVFVIATTEGVVRVPSWLGITTGSPPCITATTEFVVPRSIPIILLIATVLMFDSVQNPPMAAQRPQASASSRQKLHSGGQQQPFLASKRALLYNLSVILSSYLIPV